MRLAAQVFLAYFLILITSVMWRLLPLPRAVPDLVALSAVYLGLSARERVAPATLAAVVMGYLADLLMGGPRGLLSATAGAVCLMGHFVQGRLIVRGRIFVAGFALVVGLAAGVVGMLLRTWLGMTAGSLGHELATLGASALLTGLCGPLVFRLCRMVDARFARTTREREAALEGLLP